MDDPITPEVRVLAELAASRKPPVELPDVTGWVRAAGAGGPTMYENKNEKLNIDFQVERLTFAGLQTMDPRIVRIPPGRNNERHKHAHESLFVVLEGSGEVLIGEQRVPIATGAIAFVPRWLFHQTINTGTTDLVVLAITDFGFTSAVLGDYDRRTRLSEGGADAAGGNTP